MMDDLGRRTNRLPAVMFGYFFLITTAIYTVKPAKESLFLEFLGPQRLPYAFLLTAVLMGLAVSLNARLMEGVRRSRLLSLTLAGFAATGALFWLAIRQENPWPWLFLLLYSWGDILMVTAITQYWIFINDLFNPREAKRRLGFFVGGGLLGGIAGSMIARFRPGGLMTESLIPVSATLLAGSILVVILADKSARRPSAQEPLAAAARRREKVGFAGSFALVRKNRYLMLLSGMILAGIIVSNLVHFQFQSVAKQSFPDKNSTTSFLATFNVVILVIAYLFTTFLTAGLLKRFSLQVMLVIMPLLLGLGSAALFIPGLPLLVWAVTLKGSDKILTHSLMQSLREILYIPVPQEVKLKAKVFIDMFLNKFADGLTGLLLFAVSLFFRLTLQQTALLIFAVVGLWVVMARGVAREYVNIVKRNLQIKWADADQLVTGAIDVDLTKLVFDTLQSRERSSVLYAMNLFDLIKKENLSPELKSILSQKNAEIQARSVDSVLDAAGGGPAFDFDDSLDPAALDEQVREIMSLDVYQKLMKPRLEQAAGGGDVAEVDRMEDAKMIGLMEPGSALAGKVDLFLADPSPEVARYAADSAGRLRLRSSVPLLVDLLDRPATREPAARALAAYGPAIAGTLRDYLADPEVGLRVRRAIPDILAQAGGQRSVQVLVMELRRDAPEVEEEVIEALHKLRTAGGSIVFPEREVLTKTVDLVRKCHLILLQIGDLRQDRKKETLVKELENSLARTMKRVFELLGLVYDQEDIRKAYQNIQAGTKKALDYSIELLENVLRKEVKDLLLPLLEDTPIEEKLRHSRRLAKAADKIRFA